MSRQDTILTAGFAVFSVISSFVFVFYGVGGITSEISSQRLQLFAYVTAGYGLMNIYILSTAWRSRAAWTMVASKLISLCFLGVFIMDLVKYGMESSQDLLAAPVVAVVLAINWYAVKKQVARPE
jgi:hypothetical protein